jgi:hypothetical protein
VTPSAAATATAASAALPPACSSLRPASAARGWLQDTMPRVPYTGERLTGSVGKAIRGAGGRTARGTGGEVVWWLSSSAPSGMCGYCWQACHKTEKASGYVAELLKCYKH